MEDEFRHKIIIDPVHGDIGLSKLEIELIDTPTFQRLRRIKQLGLAYTVYPNARHSRFEHSLGVMYIMSRILESFQSKRKADVALDHFRKLRIAALLHDIGHYPYSHLMERIDWGSTQEYISKKGQGEKGATLPKPYPRHDKLGEIVITERKDIKEKLKENNIAPQEIVALIQGQHAEIPNLLNASLDVDRLDYLMRDSLNTGLPYGKVDLNYIVNNLELVKENNEKVIVVSAKARNSIEHMLMGRYFMFNTVYMHKTVFAFEEIIRRIVRILWEKGKIYKSGEEIEKMARDDSDEFLAFGDGYLDKLIDKYASSGRDKKIAALCKAVKLRKPPKLVYEVSELTLDDSPPSEKYVILRRDWETKAKEFAKDKKIKIPEEHWFFGDIKVPEFEKLHPFISLADVRRLIESGSPELRELVKVKERSGKIINLFEDKSSLLHYMSRLKPTLCRIYVLGIDDAKASEIRDKIEKWLLPEG